MPPPGTLVPHTQLPQNPARRGIAREMAAMDTNQTQFRKRVAQNSFTRFRAEALVPIWPADPVAKLSLMTRQHIHQAYRSDQGTIGFAHDGKRDALALIKVGLVRRNPLLRHPVRVRVGNPQRRIGNQPVTGQSLHLGGIVRTKRTQTQPFSFDGRNWFQSVSANIQNSSARGQRTRTP